MATAKKKPQQKETMAELKNYEQQSADSGYIRIGDQRVRFTPEEAHKVLSVRDDLLENGDCLADGTAITTPLHALRYLISRVEMDKE